MAQTVVLVLAGTPPTAFMRSIRIAFPQILSSRLPSMTGTESVFGTHSVGAMGGSGSQVARGWNVFTDTAEAWNRESERQIKKMRIIVIVMSQQLPSYHLRLVAYRQTSGGCPGRPRCSRCRG